MNLQLGSVPIGINQFSRLAVAQDGTNESLLGNLVGVFSMIFVRIISIYSPILSEIAILVRDAAFN